MANIKISQLTAKSTNLLATDLLEVSEVSGLTYVSKKITGQQIIDGIGLSNYVPYTGASANVNLGEYEIKVGQLTLDTSPTGTAAVGTTRWSDSLGSTETTLKGGSVILKNGVDLVARVVNKVTPNTTLTKAAYPVVKVSGAQGGRLAVAYAQANNDSNSADTLGVVTETIATNQEGFIITVGQLENINTTGSLQGETWADGDVLYLSPTIPGAITKVKPTGATGHIVIIGYVEYAHAINGKIYVKIMNGWELDELHNVYINTGTLANNDALIYESSTQLWKNKTIATALGYTPVTNARTISTNSPLSGGGDLTTDRTLSIADAAADGATKGAASFSASDFNSTSGNISIDYTNGQSASSSTKGFLTAGDWSTFNGKVSTGSITGSGLTMATSRLLGRTTASSGAVEEITVGSGLSLTGGTLSSTGSGIIVGSTTSSGVDSRVFFQAGGVVQQSDRFTFDNATNILQLGAGANSGVSLRTIAPGGTTNDIAFRVKNSLDTADIFSIRGNGEMYIPQPQSNNQNIIYIAGTTDSIIRYSPTVIGSIAFGQGASITNAAYYNTAIGNSATAGASASYGISIGFSTLVNSGGGIAIGDRARTSGTDTIVIGNTGGITTYSGARSIYLGKKGNSGNNFDSNDVFMTHFNSDSSSTLIRANGSLGLLGKQAYIITNGTGTFGTDTYMGNGGNTLVVRNHPDVPSLNITDSFQQYSADATTGNAAPHFRTENGSIIKLYQNTAVTNPQGIADALTNLGVLAASTIAPSVQSVASAATVTPTFANDLVKITAQAVALTLAAPTGTAIDGKDLVIRIKDNGSAQTITWTSGTGGYRAIGVTLPTTTTAGKTTYVGLIYNSDDSRWDAIGVSQEA
jgi:nitrogen fixation protein